MTHDPICPQRECDACAWEGSGCCRGDCRCEEYAKVRSDEQQQVASRLTAYHAEGCIGGVSNLGCGCGLWNDVVTYSVELP